MGTAEQREEVLDLFQHHASQAGTVPKALEGKAKTATENSIIQQNCLLKVERELFFQTKKN